MPCKPYGTTPDKGHDSMRFRGCRHLTSTVWFINLMTMRLAGLGLVPLLAWHPAALADPDSIVFAAEDLGICPPEVMPVSNFDPGVKVDRDALAIELEADEIESPDKDTVILRGNAEYQRGVEALTADQLIYNKAADEVQAVGDVVFTSPFGDVVETKDMDFQVQTRIGEAGQSSYKVADRDRYPEDPGQVYVGARGTADRIFFEGHDLVRLEGARYTTCAEGQDDVFLTAKEITLDNSVGVGIAKHVKIRFMDVPVFYWPRLSFPLNDERRTGWLSPGFGTQDGSGFILEVPYYWNIAPNQDATTTPRLLTKRGIQLTGEYRYLGESYEGIARGEFLPNDREFDDENRGAAVFEHLQDFGTRWFTDANLQWVSDDEYLEDFKNNLNLTSATVLPRIARALYSGDVWRFSGRLQDFQTIDPDIPRSSRPYKSLPDLNLTAEITDGPFGTEYGWINDFTNFVRDEALEGSRLNTTPYISFPMRRLYGFVTPKFSARYTAYDLDNVEQGQPDSPSQTVPIFSLDSGLFFERAARYRGRPFIQTLEPRLFYVFIPEEDQDDFPNFDTGQVPFNNLSNIFRENRFFGGDRVGDTNQVTLGLQSRLIDVADGSEWFFGQLGQIFFLEDPEVQLPDQPDIQPTSDTLGAVTWRLTDKWGLNGLFQWDTEESELRTFSLDVDFEDGIRRFFEFRYRFSRDRTEEVDLALKWPLARRWQLWFDQRYSLEENQNLATTIGVGYDGCCWAIRTTLQRRIDNQEEFRNAIFVEFELNGLGKITSGL